MLDDLFICRALNSIALPLRLPTVDSPDCCDNYSIMPIKSIVFPLPASPLIQSNRLLWSSRHCRKFGWSRIHLYESFNKPPLVCSMRALSSRGSVKRRSAKHRSFEPRRQINIYWSGVKVSTLLLKFHLTYQYNLDGYEYLQYGYFREHLH
jgi:hypothetical protein